MKHYYNVKNYARTPEIQELPSLIDIQLKSFEDFLYGGRLLELFDEINPIQSFNGNLSLYFPGNIQEAKDFNLKPRFEPPKFDPEACIERDMSYAAPLYVEVALVNHEQGDEIIQQDIFLGEFPLMTEKGTFIINGTERVVVSQLIRSPGVYFDAEEERATGRLLSNAKLIPDRGAWMEFETRKTDYITIKFNRKRTIPVTVLLRALAAVDDGLPERLSPIKTGDDEEIMALFADVDTDEAHPYIQTCFKNEPVWDVKKKQTLGEVALIEFYRRMRPGDPPTLDNAREYLESQLFDQRRYDLERVGRYKLNQRLELGDTIDLSHRTISKSDIVKLVEQMIRINNGDRAKDDIDHLGNRRVKTVGELIGNKLRIGLRRMERVVKERMSIREAEQLTPVSLVNIRPIVAAVREFFGSSQLSQFMEQTNPLSELRHKRTLSALGPGGLRRERAGFDVRDVHHSHYGRICPIETPEGPNIGLIGRLASYARVNELGFIETPYRKVVNSLAVGDPDLIDRIIRDDIENSRGKVILEEGTVIDKKIVTKLKRAKISEVPVVPFATQNITYLSADDEDKFIIAQANARLDEKAQFLSNRVSARFEQGFLSAPPQRIDYMDIAPRQIVGISAALIPFLSHDAANRALMGSNMQTQAVPLLTPDVSVVSTGMESQAAFDSGQVLVSEIEAEVTSVQGHRVIARSADGEEHVFQLRKYERSNQSTCIDQRPLVRKGDTIKPGDVIADSSSTYNGQLALGHDVLTCFLSWDGGNYEDALLVSEELLRADKFTSIHIEKHEIEARDTKLGPEEITYDIPNVGEEALKDLDEHGIVRIGAEVGPNDILVGKITPKGEKELSPEEKLLRAIFGEQAREVKDSSLRLPHGDRGKVIDVKVFTRDEHPDLSAGVEKMVRVSVAQRRKLTVGDKMAGRHGNKGVISKIVTVEDMPYIDGGVPVEIILNPLGVPSRMNIGQILELHLGWAADRLGFRAITPVFDGVKEQEIQAELGRAWMIDWAWRLTTERAWENHERLAGVAGITPEDFDDDMHVICAYLVDRVSESGLYDNEAIILERDEIYVRRVAVAEMLREYGFDPEAVMVYDNSELSIETRDERDANAVDVSIRIWIQEFATEALELTDDMSLRDLFDIANRIMFETGVPVPHFGKQTLYDGRTGEPFDRHVAVGYVHMLKLAHLVEDKAHARSTGPYSLVTQQPLGGKAQFGGQRFGEMEVWALEAYGAAHILQEMLTVKSDDVQGRVKTYESIVKGEPIEEPGIPTSFRVLVKELQSLGLSVEAITGAGDVIRFGKYDEQTRKPQPETGLLGLGTG
ncbi:MAG: DNA-directed RNA polymerase subunit beta [Chloroflexota bacterium]|nr:DNA-directed RNA polymerase subunit beta [Chloroflexota bacterium]MDE2948879.1 DNA-directed RNA polymerase subunit beta [Chloroflexota bacterium]